MILLLQLYADYLDNMSENLKMEVTSLNQL